MNALLLLSLAAPSLPMRFEENRGQAPASAQFAARGQGYVLLLAPTAATLQRGADALEMHRAGANPSARAEAQERSAGVSNYYRGGQAPVTGIADFRKVKYTGVYPGIDLVYCGNGKQLEYDFIVQPDADPGAIALRFNPTAHPRLDHGELVLQTRTGELRRHAPVLFQNTPGGRRKIAGWYRIEPSGAVRFTSGDYEHSAPLVIDLVLVYSTYLGGAASDSFNAIALDAAGNIRQSGDSQSTSFPVALLPAPVNHGGMDVLITTLTPDGGDLL